MQEPFPRNSIVNAPANIQYRAPKSNYSGILWTVLWSGSGEKKEV